MHFLFNYRIIHVLGYFFSPRLTAMLTAGCEIFSFCSNSTWLIANSVVAQKHSRLRAVTVSLSLPRATTCSAAISSNSATRLTTYSKLILSDCSRCLPSKSSFACDWESAPRQSRPFVFLKGYFQMAP
jgi:hypothetical protein